MFAFLLYILTIFFVVESRSLKVCRYNEQEKVVCPEDYYCCNKDKCCKEYFADEDEEAEDNEPLSNWTVICLHTFVACMFIVLILIIVKSVQYFRRYYLNQSTASGNDSNLRYVQMEKRTIVRDNNISALIGTPFYETETGTLSLFRNPGAIPI